MTNKEYYAANKEAERERCRAYHHANRERRLAVKQAYRDGRKEELRHKSKARYAAAPELYRQRSKISRAKHPETLQQWNDKNRERLKKQAAAWVQANKILVRARDARRRAAKLRATPPWADHLAIRAIYEEAERLTRQTGQPHEVDHIIPLISPVVCGLHVAHNLQILTKTENRRKLNRLHVR